MRQILILTGLLLVISYAQAKGNDGNELLSDCSKVLTFMDGGEVDVVANALEMQKCLSYVEGFNYAIRMWQLIGKESITCLPDEVNNGQSVRIVVAFARNNPALLHMGKGVLITKAYHDAFTCSDAK